jgi:ATP-dependent Lhr-like helicase
MGSVVTNSKSGSGSERKIVSGAGSVQDLEPGERWLASQGWKPFAFQRDVWDAVAHGESGLVHATTGAGKTYAVWLAALNRFATRAAADPAAVALQAATAQTRPRRSRATAAAPLTVLWLTPMRALAADTERALNAPLADLAIDWTVGVRSGDTSVSKRAQQARRLPTALITTPESLSLLLSRADARERFAHLQMVIVDEWHELIGNKRGTQTQLALARLRRWNPSLMTWGLSATLGNLPYALDVLVPSPRDAEHRADIDRGAGDRRSADRSVADGAIGDRTRGAPRLIRGNEPKTLRMDTLLPPGIERFPWAGHLGLRMLPQVVDEIASASTALIFTNTRSQSELWYQAILDARPEWAGQIAIHHGSIDRRSRAWVELALKKGTLKIVVCTSSLDLGVDFLPVERVLQIGSPKGVARMMQRAGRSGHAPGRPSRLTIVPTHSLEVLESLAAQDAVARAEVEARLSPAKPLDVLVQHLVTVALGGGFRPHELLDEVRSTYAYRDLGVDEWQWALAFVSQGGKSLTAYPEYRRAIPDEDGVWRVPDKGIAFRHRMSIGTIVSDASIAVKFWSRSASGKTLGSVEESFIARLKNGDHFLFAGRLLELVKVHEMTAFVKSATRKKAAVPRWNGGRMPLSSELSHALVARLDRAAHGEFGAPEMQTAKPLLDVQARWSALPTRTTLLAESLRSREGWHLFVYPFAGRNVHLGLASLLAYRIGRTQPNTFSIAVNDYGFELLSAGAIDWPSQLTPTLFSTGRLLEDVIGSLNATEMSRRRFREIARIAGLVFAGSPGAPKSARQLQASSRLFYDVFVNHDPENLLLTQAQAEVLRQELDVDRLRDTLVEIEAKTMQLMPLKRPSPFAFPLMVERFRESSSSEKLSDRIARMVADLEKAAGPGGYMPAESVAQRNAFNRPGQMEAPRPSTAGTEGRAGSLPADGEEAVSASGASAPAGSATADTEDSRIWRPRSARIRPPRSRHGF